MIDPLLEGQLRAHARSTCGSTPGDGPQTGQILPAAPSCDVSSGNRRLLSLLCGKAAAYRMVRVYRLGQSRRQDLRGRPDSSGASRELATRSDLQERADVGADGLSRARALPFLDRSREQGRRLHAANGTRAEATSKSAICGVTEFAQRDTESANGVAHRQRAAVAPLAAQR